MYTELDVYKRIINRYDAWAKQNTQDNEEKKLTYISMKHPLDDVRLKQSISSDALTIGTYTINPDTQTVKCAVIDIDGHNDEDKKTVEIKTKLIYDALLKKGVIPWIEASCEENINDGTHICLFLDDAPAKDVYYFFYNMFGPNGEFNSANIEYFPKQPSVEQNGFGNLVKLPWQYNNRNKKRSVILYPDTLEVLDRKTAINYLMTIPYSIIPEHIDTIPSTIQQPSIKPITKQIIFDPAKFSKRKSKCMIEAYHNCWILTGAKGHGLRLAFATELIFNGATDEDVHEYFKIQNDYNESETNKHIYSIRQKIQNGLKPHRCEVIQQNLSGFCDEEFCESCKGNILKSSLNSFKKPSILDQANEMQTRMPVYYDRSKCFWVWLIDHYERIDETDIQNFLLDIVDNESLVLGKGKSAIMDAVRISGRRRLVTDKPKHWIQLKDSVIDIYSGELIEPSPDYLFTNPIPHRIGSSTDTPTIDKLFDEWVGEQNKQLLYEMCAYCLLDDYPIHKLFLLFGKGRNGKGQFRDILINLVGKENIATTTIEGLISNRFESARLYKKKLATIGETNFKLLEDTSIIKMLTGGDPVPAEFKNKEPFDFINTAKIIINTNSLPPTTDKTDAFYSRFIIIKFENQFSIGKPIINTIPDYEYDNLVAKCLELLPKLLNNGMFDNEGTIQDKAIAYEALSNPLNEFIRDMCIVDVNEITPLWHIEDDFNDYLGMKGLRKISKKEIRKQLESNGYELKTNHVFTDFTKNGQWTGIWGIKIKNNTRLKNKDGISKNEHSKGIPFQKSIGTIYSKKSNFLNRDEEAENLESLDSLANSHSDLQYIELSESSPNTPNTPNGESQNILIKNIVKYKNLHYKLSPTVNDNFIRDFLEAFKPAYNDQIDRIKSIVINLNETGEWNRYV